MLWLRIGISVTALLVVLAACSSTPPPSTPALWTPAELFVHEGATARFMVLLHEEVREYRELHDYEPYVVSTSRPEPAVLYDPPVISAARSWLTYAYLTPPHGSRGTGLLTMGVHRRLASDGGQLASFADLPGGTVPYTVLNADGDYYLLFGEVPGTSQRDTTAIPQDCSLACREPIPVPVDEPGTYAVRVVRTRDYAQPVHLQGQVQQAYLCEIREVPTSCRVAAGQQGSLAVSFTPNPVGAEDGGAVLQLSLRPGTMPERGAESVEYDFVITATSAAGTRSHTFRVVAARHFVPVAFESLERPLFSRGTQEVDGPPSTPDEGTTPPLDPPADNRGAAEFPTVEGTQFAITLDAVNGVQLVRSAGHTWVSQTVTITRAGGFAGDVTVNVQTPDGESPTGFNVDIEPDPGNPDIMYVSFTGVTIADGNHPLVLTASGGNETLSLPFLFVVR